MNRNQVLLTKLLTATLKNKNIENMDLKNADWNAIYEEAKAHDVHTLIYPLVNSLKLDSASNIDLMSIWQKDVLLSGITQIRHAEQIGKVFDEFNQAKISFIALKGLVLRELYPNPELRTMGDGDILVQKKDIKKACSILSNMGYKKESADSKHIHFLHENHLCIEIHFLLVEKSSLAKPTDEFEARVWENAQVSHVCNAPALILSPVDQTLHLILHMAAHLSSSGFGIRQLCDFFMFMEKNSCYINWNELSKKIDEYGVTRFTFMLFVICKDLFDMPIPEIFKYQLLDDEYINDLIEDIFSGGTFGKRTQERELDSIQLRYINYKTPIKENSPSQNFITLLFPSTQLLGQQYSYAKRYPILTPAAWLHRIFYGIFRNDYSLSQKKSIMIPDKIASTEIVNRAKLLHWLDLK